MKRCDKLCNEKGKEGIKMDNSNNLFSSLNYDPTLMLGEEEARQISEVQKEFMESYSESKNKSSVNDWLPQEIKKHLPEKSYDKIKSISDEIISTIEIYDEKIASQKEAIKIGRSKESWLASELTRSTSTMTTQESNKYLANIDNAINKANKEMYDTITTKKSGNTKVSNNPNLDGFIAEQYHVNSFNIDAATKGIDAKAEVVVPKNGRYSKNGFDIVIKDSSGKIIHQYQVKYGATAEDTIRMLKSGNYNNQIIVVPEDQVETVQKAFPNKTVTSSIEYGKAKSKTLTKKEAKRLQKRAEQYEFENSSWDNVSTKDLALGISKQVGNATLQGAVVGASMNIASKLFQGEEIDGNEVVKTALTSGADAGVKAAAASALKVASEKEILTIIPKGTPASTFANIACVAVENVKVMGKVANGELSVMEGIDEMEQTTGACVAGIAASTKGAALGASLGTVLGPIGSAVGGFVGGTIGYIAGSKVGQMVVKTAQKVRNKVCEVLENIGNAILDGISAMASGISSFFERIFG